MDRSKLREMTVKALRTQAESLGVKRVNALKKDELVEAILKAEAEKKSAEKSASAPKADTKASAGSKAADAAKGEVAADAVKSDKASDASKAELKKDEKASGKDAKKASVKGVKASKAAGKDAEAIEDLEDAEAEEIDEDAEEAEDSEAEAAEEKAAEKVEEPAPVEPDSIFIDRGAILPEYVPGTCLYALVRDPGTLFVYWNATFESDNGWLLTAYDYSGNVLQSFTTPARRNGRGYFRVPTARVARVTLSIVKADGASELKLESRIRIAQQLGIAQPRPAYDERWVDFQKHKVVYEAPAPGRAPAFAEIYQSVTAPAMTGGGYDRSVEMQNGACGVSGGSLSSRFGSLPGSSDTLIGSSDRLIRK